MSKNISEKKRPAFVEQTEGIVAFWHEARKWRTLTPEEEREIVKKYEAEGRPDNSSNLTKLIMTNLTYLYSLATQFTADPTIVLELIEEGKISLMLAAKKYKSSMNVRFMTFAADYAYRDMFAFFRTGVSQVRRSNEMKIGYRIKGIKEKFFTKNMRDPSNEELKEILANEYQIAVKNDDDIREVSYNYIDAPIDEDGETSGEDSEFAVASADHNAYEDEVNADYTKKLINSSLAILDERARDIICMAFGIGYDYEVDVTDIARKYDIHPVRVNQIIKESKVKMCEYIRKNIHEYSAD